MALDPPRVREVFHLADRDRVLWKSTYGTWVLIGVNVLWFFLVESHYGYNDVGFLNSGALDAPDYQSGQWFRLFSSMFVHAGMMHIALNMVSLWSLYVVEWIAGTPFYVAAYLTSGLVGSLLSVWFATPDEQFCGASGAIFGIFGVALAFSFRGILSKTARNQLVLLLVINLVYDMTNANIGTTAHLGGLVTGIVWGWAAGKVPQKVMRWLSAAFGCLTALALILSLNASSVLLAVQ